MTEEARPLAGQGAGGLVARAASRALSGQGVMFMVQLLSVVVLTRLLTPQDFGVYTMAFAFLGIGHLIRDAGLGTAAIQAERLTSHQRSNLFWINAAIGIVLTGAAVLLSVPIAAYYEHPAVAAVMVGLAPTLLLASLVTQLRASLVRELRMGRLAVIDASSSVVALLAAAGAALAGAGYWALVVQQLASGLWTLVLVACVARWVPSWPRRGTGMHTMLRFGAANFGGQLLTYANNNLGAVLMGRFYGDVPLGYYNRGIQLVRVPIGQFRAPLDALSIATLSRLQGSADRERFVGFTQRGQLLLCYPILMLAAFLAGAGQPVVDFVLGAGWSEAGPYLRLLAVAEGFLALSSIGAWIYVSLGLTKQLMQYTLFSASVQIALLFGGAALGPLGIPAAFALAPLLLWPVSLLWAGRVSRINTKPMLVTSVRIAIWASVMALACSAVVSLSEPLSAFVQILLSLATQMAVLAVAALIPRVRRDYLECIETARMALRRG